MKTSNKSRPKPIVPNYIDTIGNPEHSKPSVNMSIVYVTLFAMVMITLFMYGA